MTDAFYRYLGLPDACFLGSRVFKKLFYENTKFSAADKKAFSEDIGDIRWQYSLKPETIGIAKYEDEEREYHEIAVLQVMLKKTNRYRRIAEIIQRAIPYPMVLVLFHNDQAALNLAFKRISRADKGRMTVESFYQTEWLNLENSSAVQQAFLESCAVNTLPFTDFYQFYKALIRRVVALNCAELNGVFTLEDDRPVEYRLKNLEAVHELKQQQASFRTEMKNETQFSRKVALNMKIKKAESRIDHYLKQI